MFLKIGVELMMGCGTELICQRRNILNSPKMVSDSCFHRGSNPQALMNPYEIVIHIMQGYRMRHILNLYKLDRVHPAFNETMLLPYDLNDDNGEGI